MAIAAWPSFAAASTASSIRSVPSTTENSVWERRWTKFFGAVIAGL